MAVADSPGSDRLDVRRIKYNVQAILSGSSVEPKASSSIDVLHRDTAGNSLKVSDSKHTMMSILFSMFRGVVAPGSSARDLRCQNVIATHISILLSTNDRPEQTEEDKIKQNEFRKL